MAPDSMRNQSYFFMISNKSLIIFVIIINSFFTMGDQS